MEPILGIQTQLTQCDGVDDASSSEHAAQLQTVASVLAAHHAARFVQYVDATTKQLDASRDAHVRSSAALLSGVLLQLLPAELLDVHLRVTSNLLAALKDSDAKVRALAARAVGSAKLIGNYSPPQ